MCFGLYRDSAVKQGQIAHVDHDRTNGSYQNLVFLCLPHHDQYDSTTRQSKNFTPQLVKRYRLELDAFLHAEVGVAWPNFAPLSDTDNDMEAPALVASSPHVYDRRIVVYRTTRLFLIEVLREATLSYARLGEFAGATDEALFVFNAEVDSYLRELYSKGVRLCYTSGRIDRERLSPRPDYSDVVRENADVLNWFSGQLEESRKLFRRFLALG